jgi:hypothetical protein
MRRSCARFRSDQIANRGFFDLEINSHCISLCTVIPSQWNGDIFVQVTVIEAHSFNTLHRFATFLSRQGFSALCAVYPDLRLTEPRTSPLCTVWIFGCPTIWRIFKGNHSLSPDWSSPSMKWMEHHCRTNYSQPGIPAAAPPRRSARFLKSAVRTCETAQLCWEYHCWRFSRSMRPVTGVISLPTVGGRAESPESEVWFQCDLPSFLFLKFPFCILFRHSCRDSSSAADEFPGAAQAFQRRLHCSSDFPNSIGHHIGDGRPSEYHAVHRNRRPIRLTNIFMR